jgi:hypothetical protein
MKLMRNGQKSLARKKGASIRTSILELMQELSKLTNDDNLVIAAVKNIFGVYEVRLAGAPVPVRLVNTDIPDWDYLDRIRRRKKPR